MTNNIIGPVEAAETFANHVRGTASMSGVADILEQLGLPAYEDDKTFCATLDQLVFECDCCGWWCDTDEVADVSNDMVCEECHDATD